jgi:hypothetical protein
MVFGLHLMAGLFVSALNLESGVRWLFLVVLFGSGLASWRYHGGRSMQLQFRDRQSAWLVGGDGTRRQVHRIAVGWASDRLLLASIEPLAGRPTSLFVCSDPHDRAAHWRLRRALLAFGSAPPAPGKGLNRTA